MQREFDPDWPHGHETVRRCVPARIIARDLRGEYPFAVVIEEDDADEVYTYTRDGRFNAEQAESSLDLRNRARAS